MPETAARHLDLASPLSARRSGPLRGKVRVPGDKSISAFTLPVHDVVVPPHVVEHVFDLLT